MNRVVADVYAISITHEGTPLDDARKLRLADLVPELVAEINRLEAALEAAAKGKP